MSEKTKKTINIILIVLTIIMSFPIFFYIYMQFWGKDKLPTPILSSYVTTITDPHTQEELKPIEANYYANKNGKGKEVMELLFNCYSGVEKQAIYSRGFQLVYEKDGSSNLYYYDRYDGVSFETGHKYDENSPFLIDIDGITYAMKLDGEYTVTTYELNTKKIARTAFCLGINLLFEDVNYQRRIDTIYTYTFEDLLNKLRSIIKSSSNNYGDHTIPLIDLGDFLHIYELDENNRVIGDPINRTAFTNSYFSAQTHYDNRGIVWAKQSLFKSVAKDSNYNVTGINDTADYWQVKSQINISEKDMTSRNTSDGLMLSLSLDKLKELKSYSNIDIIVTIDLNKINENVAGFDYFSFYGLKLSSLTIKTNTPQNFILSRDSLKDSGISNIFTLNITLINNDSGVIL